MREKLASYSSREVAPFTQAASLGVELARLQPGETLRVHLFGHTTTNGDQTITSTYQRQITEQTLNQVIARHNLNMTIRRDGLDFIVEAK